MIGAAATLGVLLGLTVLEAEAVRPVVTLGDPVEVQVWFASDAPEDATLPQMVLAETSITLDIAREGSAKSFRCTRTFDASDLSPRHSASGKVAWIPVRSGKYAIGVDCAGRWRAATEVTVTPAEGGATELGFRLETTDGTATFRFLPDAAPNHASQFAQSIRLKNYDSTAFFRIVKGAFAQGGDVTGTYGPISVFTLPVEEPPGPCPLRLGVVAAVRDRERQGSNNGMQFVICFDDAAEQLEGKVTVFAELVEGKAMVRKLEELGLPRGDPRNGRLEPGAMPMIVHATLVPLKVKGS